MKWSRLLGMLTAALATAACAVVAIGMANAAGYTHHRHRLFATPTSTPRPAYLPLTVEPTSLASPASPVSSATTSPRVTARASPTSTPTPTSLHPSAAPLRPSGSTSAERTTSTPTPSSPAPKATPASTATLRSVRTPVRPERRTTSRAVGAHLPLHLRTHNARQVITVVARSRRSTVATLQAWRKLRSGGWVRRGPHMRAHIGSAGMTWHASESKSATPMGSFTLTHGFGHKPDPGTALPYLHTNPADWWISQSGPLYNTHQRCWSRCPFIQGAPNEHLYYETPYYNYAVVIDYNTRNAPGGVKQGRGSAFFLHVTVGRPTAGCVAIPQARLVSIMRWLAPRKHPRILIGVG